MKNVTTMEQVRIVPVKSGLLSVVRRFSWPSWKNTNRKCGCDGIPTKTILIMKLVFLLLTTVFLHAYAGTSAQVVSLTGKNIPFRHVMEEVKKQSGYVILTTRKLLDEVRPVSLSVHNMPLMDFLNLVLKDQPLQYRISDKTILLTRKDKDDPAPGIRQPLTDTIAPVIVPVVSGIITDSAGAPVIGATIRIKATKTVTASDKDGKFLLPAVHNNAVLQISSIGYDSREVTAGAGILTIRMKRSVTRLDETVVLGYGKTSRRTLIGSIAKVGASEIDNQPVGNIFAAISGRMAGVDAVSSGGYPRTAGYSIKVRGAASITAGADPLYIVDGIPVQTLQEVVNPADVESIEVLKDADATAIYGSRGANGVVLITTKKGKAGKTAVNLDVYTGVTDVSRRMDLLNTTEYLDLRRKAFAAQGIAPNTGSAPDLLVWDTTQHHDWQKYLMGNRAPFTNVQLDISGGDERTQFMLSFGGRHEGSVLVGKQYNNRYNGRLNIQHRSVNNRFSLSAGAMYTRQDVFVTGNDPSKSLLTPPDYPLYDSTGKPYFTASGMVSPATFFYLNSLTQTSFYVGNASLRYKLLAPLELKVDLGYASNLSNSVTKNLNGSLNPYISPYSRIAYYLASEYTTYNIEPQLNYHLSRKKHSLELLLGATAQRTTTKANSIAGAGYTSDDLLGSIGAANVIFLRTSDTRDYKYQSLFSRVIYSFDEKYLLSGIFRTDGSSRFGPANRYGKFWSVGAAWIFTEESIFRNALPFVSFGKLKLSYGKTGNDQIGDYKYLSIYSPSFVYNDANTITPTSLGNDLYSWENTNKLDIALELSLFNHRITLNSNFFSNTITNPLVNQTVPSQTGFSSYVANLNARVQSRGWEFELNAINMDKHNFRWVTAATFSITRNKLLSFPDLQNSVYANLLEVGKSINLYRGYKFTGVDANTGLAKMEDIDKNGVITYPNDYQTLGGANPDFYGGIGNTFTYKGLSLDIFVQFRKQPWQFGYLYLHGQPLGMMQNVKRDLTTKYWKGPGDTQASVPGLAATSASPVYRNFNSEFSRSDAAYSDASFIRVKNISLSYTLPARWANKAQLKEVKIYLRAQNPFLFTKYDALDPESGLTVPVLRNWTAGINIKL